MRFCMFCRSNSAITSPFLILPPGFGSSSNTSMKSPSLPIEPPPPGGPPPPLPVEPPTKPPAVDPSPLVPDELLSEPPEAFLLELLAAEAELRSEKRLVEPLLAPKLEDAWAGAPVAELSDEDEVLALLDEVIVIVEALCELEPDDELLPDEEEEPDEEPPPPPP